MNRYFKDVCVDTRVHGANVGKWLPLVMTAKSQYSDQLLRTSKGKYCTQSAGRDLNTLKKSVIQQSLYKTYLPDGVFRSESSIPERCVIICDNG